MGRQVRDRVRLPFPGPFPEGDGPRAALPDGAFAAPHAGVEDIQSVGLAVVVHEDEDRVVLQFTLPEMPHQPSEVVVEVGDHAEIGGLLVIHLAAERRREFRGGGQRRMRRIGGEVAEEGGVLALIDEGHGLIEKDVLPVAFPRLALAVADHDRIEVDVRAADIGGGPFEPALLGSIVPFAAQVPLADEARSVACLPQELRQEDGVLVQVFPRQGGVRDAVAELVHARQERRARRRAGRAHVELFEAHALVEKRIQIRGLEQWVPVPSQVAIALVVRQDEDDVRFRRGSFGGPEHGRRRQQQGGEDEESVLHDERGGGRVRPAVSLKPTQWASVFRRNPQPKGSGRTLLSLNLKSS